MDYLPNLVLKKPDFPRSDFDTAPPVAILPNSVDAHPQPLGELLWRHGPPQLVIQSHKRFQRHGFLLKNMKPLIKMTWTIFTA